MIIGGLEKSSVVDFPGTVAAVVFVAGCNFDCWYCHNRALLDPDAPAALTVEELLAFLGKRRGLLGGVVVSGGEPTLQKDLPAFVEKVRALGYRVKLDTNGSHPERLNSLLNAGLLDYVAMDVKAPWDAYPQNAGTNIDVKKLQQSVELLAGSGVAHEFRTTFVPTLSPADIGTIARSVGGAPLYALQQYRPPGPGIPARAGRLWPQPHGPGPFAEALRMARPHVQKCIARGIAL
jgi:pyruvate formate lyase activating enzyme